MRYPECKPTCQPDQGIHDLGDRLITEQALRSCPCGAKGIPHRGMLSRCPLSDTGAHNQQNPPRSR